MYKIRQNILLVFLIFSFTIINSKILYALEVYGRTGASFGQMTEENILFYPDKSFRKQSYNLKYYDSKSFNLALGIDTSPIPLRIEIEKIIEIFSVLNNYRNVIPDNYANEKYFDGYITYINFTPLFSYLWSYPYIKLGLGKGTISFGTIKQPSNILSYGFGMVFNINSYLQIEVGFKAITDIWAGKARGSIDGTNGSFKIPYNSNSITLGIVVHS